VLGMIFDARAWQRPQPQVRIELRPAHVRNLGAALAGEDEQLDEGRIDRLERLRRLPNARKLVVGVNALTWRFPCWRFHPFARRVLKHAALDAPIEQLADCSERAVGQHRHATIDEAIKQRDDVAPGDAVDRSMAPGWQHLTLENALGGTPAPRVELGMTLDETLGDDGEGLWNRRRQGFSLSRGS
jgi:hypothetical protein